MLGGHLGVEGAAKHGDVMSNSCPDSDPARMQEAPAAGIVLQQRSLSQAGLIGKLRAGRTLIIALVDMAKLTGCAAGAAGGYHPYSGGSAKPWEGSVEEDYFLDAPASAPVRRTRSAHSYTGAT